MGSSNNTTGGSTMYNPFVGRDGADDRYKLRKTSKAAVRDVCTVKAQEIACPMNQRAQYADQAGFEPTGYEEIQTENGLRKAPQFELDDIWSGYHVQAALAQALFAGFPTIVQYKPAGEDGVFTVEIIDEELFDALDDAVVNEAFLDFNAARNGIQKALQKNYGGLMNALHGNQGAM